MQQQHPPPSGKWFWSGLVLGGGVVLFGLAGLLRNSDQTMPGNWLKFFAGSLVLHDGFFGPAALVTGVILAATVPAIVRPYVMGAVACSAMVTVLALPVLQHKGRLANNPSILPRDYTQGWLICLAVIWGVAAALALARIAGARARPG